MFKWFSDEEVSARNGCSATIGMKEWLAIWALNFVSVIPIIGFIVYLIIFIKLGWGEGTAPSLANQIKLNLIISLIVALVVILAVVTGVIGGLSWASSLAR